MIRDHYCTHLVCDCNDLSVLFGNGEQGEVLSECAKVGFRRSSYQSYIFNMAANVYVSVSGPALSFLLYENVRSLSDQVIL